MSRSRLRFALAAGLVGAGLAGSVGAQAPTPACTQPLDPACNHLKCYQIKDKPITASLQVDNQFGREKLVVLQPVLLCLPTQKSCCVAGAGCSPANCPANPVPAPGLPHFKCYTIKGKTTCPPTDPQCASVTKFPTKSIQVTLRDQFGTEGPLPVGAPRLFCAPVEKTVVGRTTTTTSTTTSTTIQTCHFDAASPTGCTGPCPATAPPGAQCQRTAPDKCDCVPPPVCCECQSAGCFDTTTQCPPGCAAVADADCDPATGHCGCGFCRGGGACLVPAIPCSANQPCPQGAVCDPVNCPRPCGGPCDQPAGTCSPAPCFRADGTAGECRPNAVNPCGCCGPTGSTCTTDFDCCSLVCNVANNTCQ